MKPTATKCADGKRHRWQIIEVHHEFGARRDFKWCSKCGCRTETIDGKRCIGDSGNRDYIEIPSHYTITPTELDRR